MTIGVVVLTGVALLGSAAVLGAEPAPQAGPEQHEHTPLLLRGADQLFSSTGDEGSWKSPGRSDGDTGQQPFDWVAERRACEGCPPRSVGRALFQTTIINVFYEAANLIRGQVTAKITPKTWWANMETRLGLGPGRFRRQSGRPPVPGQQLLHVGPCQWPELLRVGGVDRLRQRHLGVLRRDQPRVAERFHQHHPRRHCARRDVLPGGAGSCATPAPPAVGDCGARSGRPPWIP